MESKHIFTKPLKFNRHYFINDIEYGRRQSREVLLFHVDNYPGRSLFLVKNQTEEICIMHIKLSPTHIRYVRNQTLQMCEIAVEIDATSIQYFKHKPFHICFRAISRNGWLLRYVPNHTHLLRSIALKTHSGIINIIKSPSHTDYIIALKDKHSIDFMRTPPFIICIISAMQFPGSEEFIRDNAMKSRVKAYLTKN